MDLRRLNHAEATDTVIRLQKSRTGVMSASPSWRPITKIPLVSHLSVNMSA